MRETGDESALERSSAAFWHATALHYIPYLLSTGCLYSQRQIRERGLPLSPRRTVERRDRSLGLDRYVHLSPKPITALLRDKLEKGWPHALIEFDAAVGNRPDAAAIPYNPKSWRHREDFVPVTNPVQRSRLLAGAQTRRNCPSAELLLPDCLPLLPHARFVHFANAAEAAFVGGLIPWTGLPGGLPLRVSPEHFPLCHIAEPGRRDDTDTLADFHSYAEACRSAGRLLPPPNLPFD